VIYNIQNPNITKVTKVIETNRGTKGFGSTGVNDLLPQCTAEDQQITNNPCVRTTATQHTTEKPYDIYFSHDPFDQTLELDIAIKGDHPTLGIQSNYCPYRQ
jgi:hypothetical protein